MFWGWAARVPLFLTLSSFPAATRWQTEMWGTAEQITAYIRYFQSSLRTVDHYSLAIHSKQRCSLSMSLFYPEDIDLICIERSCVSHKLRIWFPGQTQPTYGYKRLISFLGLYLLSSSAGVIPYLYVAAHTRDEAHLAEAARPWHQLYRMERPWRDMERPPWMGWTSLPPLAALLSFFTWPPRLCQCLEAPFLNRNLRFIPGSLRTLDCTKCLQDCPSFVWSQHQPQFFVYLCNSYLCI